MNKKDKNYPIIFFPCILTFVIYLVTSYIVTDGNLAFPLDDSWIHIQFADNFSSGYFFHFNPGEPTAGTTSPLWVVLNGITYLLLPFPVFFALFYSAIFYLLSCIFIYKISLLIFRSEFSPLDKVQNQMLSPEFVSLIISLLSVFAGRFAWSSLSGMETTMFTFLSLLGIYFYLKWNFIERRNLMSQMLLFIIFGLAATARPEGFLLFGILVFDSLITTIKNKSFKKSLPAYATGIFIFAILSFPYLIFSYITSGHFFPNTFRGQGGGLHSNINWEYIKESLKLILNDNLITGIFYIFLLPIFLFNLKKYFSEFRLINIILLWIILLPIISAFIAPNWRHHGRYLIPLIPLIMFAGVYFLIEIFSFIKNNTFRKIAFSRITISLILFFSFTYYAIFAVTLGLNTDNINNQQVKLAHWVKENVSPDETIALNDIGAITYMTKNHIIDMAGLVTPEFLRFRTYNWEDNLDSMFYLLKKNNVSYIIIYDHWFSEFLEKYGDAFEYIHSAILDNNTICGGDEMKVYKTNFYRRD